MAHSSLSSARFSPVLDFGVSIAVSSSSLTFFCSVNPIPCIFMSDVVVISQVQFGSLLSSVSLLGCSAFPQLTEYVTVTTTALRSLCTSCATGLFLGMVGFLRVTCSVHAGTSWWLLGTLDLTLLGGSCMCFCSSTIFELSSGMQLLAGNIWILLSFKAFVG